MFNNAYDDFSQDYDRFVNWEARLSAEIPFIENQLGLIKHKGDQPLSVLDAACGTGMHAIELARRGYYASGADLSSGMIAVAQRNASKAGVEVPFKNVGFKELHNSFNQENAFPFDAILCLGNSLPHLITKADLREALLDFSACLRPGGMLLLQNRNFDAVMAEHDRWMEPQYYREDKYEWLFLRFYDFDADGLITFNIVRLKRKDENPWTQAISSSRLYPLTQKKLVGLLEDSGFNDIQCFGMMKDSAFDIAFSENLVIRTIRS